LGPTGEKDFTERLQLLVVGSITRDAEPLAGRLRARVGGESDVLARDTVPRARRALREHTIDCVVLRVPSSEALAALEAVQSIVSGVPVVVVTDSSDRATALSAIHAGAQDYLIDADTDPDALDRSIRYAIERKRTAARLAHQALHDSLTGLPNRVLLLDRLNVAVGRSRRRPTSLALLFLDLDGFKRVNDSLGHDAGDDLLVEVARRLQRTLRPGDTVVGYGGDEFVILCEDLRGEREALRVAERARAAVAEPFLVHSHELDIRASVGVARARPGQTYARDLIREADLAMYRAKQLGSGVELFDAAVTPEAVSELETEHQLRSAIELGELRLHYQPIFTLDADRTTVALEALIRWEHRERGLLAPSEFLPLAEETGLIAQIDQWVLAQACLQLARWRVAGLVADGVCVSVNISSGSLGSPSLIDAVDRALAGARLPPAYLSLEVTEASVDEEPVRAGAVLEGLERLGVRLCLDDFGTGYSSLSALSRFPFDVVKLDDSVTRAAAADPKAARLLEAVIGVARAAKLRAVAEGIETTAQLEVVRDLECDGGQGFLLAAPAPADDVEAWLRAQAGP
jgi:diguanylate cyclase (GGDEF)-like protein